MFFCFFLFFLFLSLFFFFFFFFSSRRRHTRFDCEWSSDVCSSDLARFFPSALVDCLVVPWELPGESEQERERMLGDANRVSTGRAHDQDAAPRSFFQVDIVDANAGAADDPEARSFLQQFGSHFRGAPHHECIRIRDLGVKIVLRRQDDVPAGAAQQLYAAFTDLICNNNFHRASSDLLADCALRRLKSLASKRITVAASSHTVKLSAREQLGLYGDQREHRFNVVLLGGLLD